jgi:hypothetical protein
MINFLSGPFLSKSTEFTDTIKAAFPAHISNDCTKVAKILPPSNLKPIQFSRKPIYLQQENIQIPERIYSPEPKQLFISSLTPIQFSIFCCLYTRHHNGHIRQKYAELLLSRNDLWIPPYILHLLGEYVLEIIIMLQLHTTQIISPQYKDFIDKNPDFIRFVTDRIVSYWDCYYRRKYPNFRDYPGFILADHLNLWDYRTIPNIAKLINHPQ